MEEEKRRFKKQQQQQHTQTVSFTKLQGPERQMLCD